MSDGTTYKILFSILLVTPVAMPEAHPVAGTSLPSAPGNGGKLNNKSQLTILCTLV